jgi:TPR repeat protein
MPFREWKPLTIAEVPLGAFSDSSRGLTEDDAEVAEWLRGSAERGNAEAQFNLALMLAKGQGVPTDYVAAHMWAGLAATGSGAETREHAAGLRAEIAARMTPDELSEAERRAQGWRPKT